MENLSIKDIIKIEAAAEHLASMCREARLKSQAVSTGQGRKKKGLTDDQQAKLLTRHAKRSLPQTNA